MMKKTISLLAISCFGLLVGCQSTSQQFNGKTGYQVEQHTANQATISYTLASDRNPAKEAIKLQDACKQTLGLQKNYQVQIVSSQEIANPIQQREQSNIQLGNSRTSFGFSNTPHLNNNQEAYAARQVDETKPAMLKIVRFTCSS